MPSLEAPVVTTGTMDVPARSRTLEAILWGGLCAGVLDALYAMTVAGLRGVPPDRVWQGVASGLLGKESYQGGFPTAALGVAIHFFIAMTAAAVYVCASHKLPLLRRRPFACGPAYGLMVYAFMNYVVIPLTFGRVAPFHLPRFLGGIAIHALGVGLPIALSARRALGPRA